VADLLTQAGFTDSGHVTGLVKELLAENETKKEELRLMLFERMKRTES
jgi:hypothetical protein